MAGQALDPERFGSCHACGARLRIEEHYYLETQSHEESHRDAGGMQYGAALELRWVHIPCPYCDEPEPIQSLRHTWRQAALMLGFGLAVFALVATILWQMLA